jgi:DNA-binding protein H-NS
MNAEMRRSSVGDYVLHTDHLAAMAKLERQVEAERARAEARRDAELAELAEARRERDRLRAVAERRCVFCKENESACASGHE